MSEYTDLLDCLRISDEDVLQFKDNHPGFCGYDASRISFLLNAQLTAAGKHRVFNTFSVTDVIQDLEGFGRRGCAKGVEPFKHLPLKGLWKVHFFDARFIIRNLIKHWGLEFEDSPKFKALCAKVVADEENQPTKDGWQGRLAYEMSYSGYKDRAEQKKLTGEWLIFSRYEGLNYYLCVVEHSKSNEDDEKIFAMINACCAREYPFLFKNNL